MEVKMIVVVFKFYYYFLYKSIEKKFNVKLEFEYFEFLFYL